MARALLRSPDILSVTGYDLNQSLVQEFHAEAQAVGKSKSYESLKDAVDGSNVILIVLVNEKQCRSVCNELLNNSIMTSSQCLVLCSTVSPAFARGIQKEFAAVGIDVLDCPISGGPVRAREGTITLMCSGLSKLDHEHNKAHCETTLNALGKTYNCGDEVGLGQTVKMVHQLLAGVHICAAAEALSLAAKAGVDVQLMYDVVTSAAGNSWMFADRGKRMIEGGDEVKSALSIFVKDLDIVYGAAKELKSPIPLAGAALQQFISAVGLGLGQKDDSQLTKVYEQVTGVPVAASSRSVTNGSLSSGKRLGDEVGDYWEVAPGVFEEIVEVAQEPRHFVVIENEYARVLKVKFAPNYTTEAHRHAEDSLYYFLVEDGLSVINHVKGNDPCCDCMEFGEVRFGNHKEDKPLVHKITNLTKQDMFCIDAEVKTKPPVVSALPLVANYHNLIKTRDKCRVYHIKMSPGEKTSVSYCFFYLNITLRGGCVKYSYGDQKKQPNFSWTQNHAMGDCLWKEPVVDLNIENVGDTVYEAYISEWR